MSHNLVLKIDNREKELKSYFETLKNPNIVFLNLDVGDIIIEKDNKPLLVFERKTITDLSSSICDGRYKEQKTRLLSNILEKKRIYYIIEGDLCKTKVTVKGGTNTLQSSVVTALLRDGIRVYKTASIKETILFIEKMYQKYIENYEEYEDDKKEEKNISETDYVGTIKIKKKDNINPKVWYLSSLISIPQLTDKIADAIVGIYPSFLLLINAYNNLLTKTEKQKMLENITYTSLNGKVRRVGPYLSFRIYELIHSDTF